MIDNDILEERLDELSRELKAYVDHRIVEAIIHKQPQQRPDLFWREIKNIFSEESQDTPLRLMNFLAAFAKNNDVSGAEEIYQHGYAIHQRYYQ